MRACVWRRAHALHLRAARQVQGGEALKRWPAFPQRILKRPRGHHAGHAIAVPQQQYPGLILILILSLSLTLHWHCW